MARTIAHFIQSNLPLVDVPFVPGIRIHKAAPVSGLKRLAEQDASFGSPYWAHYWSGGLVLARYILDNPARVAGKRILDLGTGSGLVAIAAAKAGASAVLAVDVDPYAIAATRLNAAGNGVIVATWTGDPTLAEPPGELDLVTVGDLFYESGTAARLIAFLHRCAEREIAVLIGDPWRAWLPHDQLEAIATYHVSEATGEACDTARPGTIFSLRAGRRAR